MSAQTPAPLSKRRIRCNAWGNWRAYLGAKCVLEFGPDDVAAGHWLLTGEYGDYSGYSTPETISAARDAAFNATKPKRTATQN